MHIHAEGPAFFAWLPKMFGKRVVVTVHGIDWKREKWQSGLGSKFIHQGEKNAAKYADEVIVLSKGVQDYFKETYGRETHFIPIGTVIHDNTIIEDNRKTQDHKTAILSTAAVLKLSNASVTSYLPYEKGVYFPSVADKKKISVGAERQRRYRAVRKLRTEPTEEHLWEVVP